MVTVDNVYSIYKMLLRGGEIQGLQSVMRVPSCVPLLRSRRDLAALSNTLCNGGGLVFSPQLESGVGRAQHVHHSVQWLWNVLYRNDST